MLVVSAARPYDSRLNNAFFILAALVFVVLSVFALLVVSGRHTADKDTFALTAMTLQWAMVAKALIDVVVGGRTVPQIVATLLRVFTRRSEWPLRAGGGVRCCVI